MKIAASVITFNPNIEQLKLNLKSLSAQVDLILIFDNASTNINEILLICKSYSAIVVRNEKNQGISDNLNDALSYCKENGYEWLLTMDQDSICSHDLIDGYLDAIEKHPEVVSFCPFIQDRNLNNSPDSLDEHYVNSCITSGNLVNVNFCLSIGGFDPYYFIDCVDFDLSASIIVNGGKILMIPSVSISHAVGNARKHSFLGKKIISYNHPAFRSFYIVRNGCYFKRKFRRYKEIVKTSHPLLKQLVVVTFYEKNKISKIKNSLKGYFAYKSKRI